MNRKTNMQSEGYNSGWLVGNARFINNIHRGFGGKIPEFVIEALGTEKEIKRAIKEDKRFDQGKHDYFTADWSWQNTEDFDAGEDDGYEETKEDVFAAYKAKKMKVPKFIKDDFIFDERIPMEWGKDVAADEYWSVHTPMLYQIRKLKNGKGSGPWRLVYWNDDRKEIGIYPTLKEAKAAAECYIPECV
jgi:hypothetical protein